MRQGTLLEGRTVLFGVRGTGVWGECLLGTGQTHLVRALVSAGVEEECGVEARFPP